MTLLDTNVILDVIGPPSDWQIWSVDALDRCRQHGPLWVNEVVFAELSARINSEPDVQRVLSELELSLERIPTTGLFVAGQTYRRYRKLEGSRLNVLPDFFIGAHAEVSRVSILTRDARPYRTYFPQVRLITPDASD
jgi:predicted nucleic acid-binding protein